MRLAATILAGGNRESAIVGAIESVLPIVDHVILLDSGESAQKAIIAAREMLGDKCTVRQYPHEKWDCATARNVVLDCAAELGFDWALMLDTDERFHAKPEDVRRMLSEVQTETVLVADAERDGYKKNKFFSLPRQGYWDARVHEGFRTGQMTLARGMSFSELGKTPEEHLARTLSIEAISAEELAKNPDDPRMHYYHADALFALERFDEAVEEFIETARITGWTDERDWSVYRAAVIMFHQKRYLEAAELCINSSLRIPELPWWAAFCLHIAEQHDRAIYWAQRAARVAIEQRKTDRLGFCEKFAWFEGPHDVMHWAYRALGEEQLANDALAMVSRMARLRTSDATYLNRIEQLRKNADSPFHELHDVA